MRHLLLTIAVLASGLVAAPAAATSLGDGNLTGLRYLAPGGAHASSTNVVYLGTLLTESPGIGGRFLEVDGQPRFYTTGAKGLSIYDVSNPTVPVLMGHLPLAHFQNEDVDVSDDGSRVIISVDTAGVSPLGGSPATTGGVYVIDITEQVPGRVLVPEITGYVAEANHTTTCADPACEWLYGSSGDLMQVTAAGVSTVGALPTGGHAFNRDAAGYVISDSSPRLVLDVREDPGAPEVVTRGTPTFNSGYLQHNNLRLDAEAYVPRDPADPADAFEDGVFDGTGALRPGELMIGNAESNLNPMCNNAGGISTWDMRAFETGRQIEQIEILQPANGLLATDGRPAVNALGCSGHWFTESDGLIAASWYEHGTRFIEVDHATGALTEVGWFQPVATEAGAAHFVGTLDVPGVGTLDIVYNVDYARGIDIIGFDRDSPLPADEDLVASWLANLDRAGTGTFANTERLLCRIGARG
jgi:hypothetical protein